MSDSYNYYAGVPAAKVVHCQTKAKIPVSNWDEPRETQTLPDYIQQVAAAATDTTPKHTT